MASTSSTPTTDPEESAAKAVNKRYDGLITVRTKAIKGKGAWYWAHLEPILILNHETNIPKAVKLKCCLCDAVFSASNPSRTASEHLKRGTCPNFASSQRPSSAVSPLPISSVPSPSSHNHRKRGSRMVAPLDSPALVETSRYNCNDINYGNSATSGLFHHQQHQQLVLSGGKDDLGALAMLENSVKKLKSPKASPGPSLNKDQVDAAMELLSDWFYESCGSVSLSSLEHPKFRAFLNQVGLPCMSKRDLSGPRLENKFHEAKNEVDARIREAMFFQVACNGWKGKTCCNGGEENLVKFSVNLPNGTSVYQKAVLTGGSVSSKYAEEIMWEAVLSVCGGAGNGLQRCIGIVADKYKAKALKNLEVQYQWMVNVSCQVQGLFSLIKYFSKELQLFKSVTENCLKLANFVNTRSQVRTSFQKYRTQELECGDILRVPSPKCVCTNNSAPVYKMVEEILSCARVLQMVALEESFKVMCVDDPVAREICGTIQSESFWHDLEAVYSLMKLIKGMAQEIEAERPLIGQCLPLWEDLKSKVKNWCTRFSVDEGNVEKIVEKRFKKNYHPAWAASFILDPLYLLRDSTGKYLPPFKCLTLDQEKDVDKLITRLVSGEEAHIALMELMKWRSEGLDPLYAQAVQVKQRDPVTGKMKMANPQSSRLVWETCLSDQYKTLAKVAVRLIFLHATSCGFSCNDWRVHRPSKPGGFERAQKLMFIAAHAKLERRNSSTNEEEKDVELQRTGSSEDEMLTEVFADTTSV